MCSTISTHLRFKPPNLIKCCTNNSRSQKYCFRSQVRNPMLCCSQFSVLARACSDGGQADFFSAKKLSSSSVSNLLYQYPFGILSFCIFHLLCACLNENDVRPIVL